jgi:hypothetical protein
MTKKEVEKLNSVKRVKMADIKDTAEDKKYREGYRAGFNTCRRRIRRLLVNGV